MSTETIVEDGISVVTVDTSTAIGDEDDTTLVESFGSPSPQVAPQSRFLRIYNTSTVPPLAPLTYVDGDPEANGAEAEEETNGGFFERFVRSRIKSLGERFPLIKAFMACF